MYVMAAVHARPVPWEVLFARRVNRAAAAGAARRRRSTDDDFYISAAAAGEPRRAPPGPIQDKMSETIETPQFNAVVTTFGA
jgi:hypothetical protein